MKALNKAMIIDDDELNNYICSKIITYTGFAKDTVDFTNAKKALTHLIKTMNENPDDLPEIIFLDLDMPGIDGWAFLKEYEKLDKIYKDKIYLSILTTSVYESDRYKAEGYSDVDTYLCKPLSADELFRISNEMAS
ncbi:two-component system response regulator [Bacteroidota bacterium]